MVAPIFQKLPITEDQLADFCRKHRIQRMSVFGSVLREDFGPESDVDFLVEFDPDSHLGWGIVGVCDELEKLIGRHVDVVNPKYLKQRLRKSVLESAQLVYSNA
jgi:predicted nucleotidyltransferase